MCFSGAVNHWSIYKGTGWMSHTTFSKSQLVFTCSSRTLYRPFSRLIDTFCYCLGWDVAVKIKFKEEQKKASTTLIDEHLPHLTPLDTSRHALPPLSNLPFFFLSRFQFWKKRWVSVAARRLSLRCSFLIYSISSLNWNEIVPPYVDVFPSRLFRQPLRSTISEKWRLIVPFSRHPSVFCLLSSLRRKSLIQLPLGNVDH